MVPMKFYIRMSPLKCIVFFNKFIYTHIHTHIRSVHTTFYRANGILNPFTSIDLMPLSLYSILYATCGINDTSSSIRFRLHSPPWCFLHLEKKRFSFFFLCFFPMDLLLLTHILFSHHLFCLTRTNMFKTCRNLFVVSSKYCCNRDVGEYEPNI